MIYKFFHISRFLTKWSLESWAKNITFVCASFLVGCLVVCLGGAIRIEPIKLILECIGLSIVWLGVMLKIIFTFRLIESDIKNLKTKLKNDNI